MGIQMRGGSAALKRGGFASAGALGGKKGKAFRLPVIPPDALLSLKTLGILLAGVSAYTLVALLSPNGVLTPAWAQRAAELAGWAAGPWCVLALCAGLALCWGRKSLRRAVAGRLAGATLLLVAVASIHQLTGGLPAGAAGI